MIQGDKSSYFEVQIAIKDSKNGKIIVYFKWVLRNSKNFCKIEE